MRTGTAAAPKLALYHDSVWPVGDSLGYHNLCTLVRASAATCRLMHSYGRYIVGRACKGMPNAGLYNGLFNMSQCFPEIAISLVGLVLFGLGGNDKTLFLVGAVGAVSACCLVPWIVEPDEEANQEVAEAPEHEAADCGAPLIPKKENSSDHLDTSWSL